MVEPDLKYSLSIRQSNGKGTVVPVTLQRRLCVCGGGAVGRVAVRIVNLCISWR
jgi:hypothetical protein